jgi:hypothetical protein
VLIFLVAVVFRFAFISIYPQPFIFDQREYHDFALGIVQKGLYVQTARTYGYPIFLAFIYEFFGSDNNLAWQTAQILLDSSVAVMVYLIGKKLFSKGSIGIAAGLIYAFNPYTSAYVGVRLSEILAIFLVTLSMYLTLRIIQKPRLGVLIILSLVLGYLPHVRSSYFLFVPLIFIYMIFRTQRFIKTIAMKASYVIFLSLVFLVPFFYPLIGNMRDFHMLAPFTVDNLFIRELYISLFVEKLEYKSVSRSIYPAEVLEVYDTYSFLPQIPADRKMMAKKYLDKSLEIIRKDPTGFIVSRLRKFIYVWQKNMFLPYPDPGAEWKYPVFFTSILNFFIVSLGHLGVLWSLYNSYRKKEKTVFGFAVLSLVLLFYVTFMHAFSASDERYSLPAYPVIFIYFTYFANFLTRLFSKKANQ